MSPIIYFVEGNIGAGKSSFLKNVQKHFSSNPHFKNVQFLQEPVDIWKDTRDKDGENILKHFYADMNRFCYTFQSFAFISRINQLDAIDNNVPYIFIERSVHCDRNVFASACHDSGMMTDIEWQIYNTWFCWMEKKYKHIFDTARYIYLKCSPETARTRITTRARTEENNISLDYLEILHKKHDDWLCADNSNTIIIDAEQNLLDDDTLLKSIAHIITSMDVNQEPIQHTDAYNNVDWNSLAKSAAIAAKVPDRPRDLTKLL